MLTACCSFSMEEQLAADGVAQRSAVVTPVPAFGSSVYRFLDPEDRDAISPAELRHLPSSQLGASSLAYSHARQIKVCSHRGLVCSRLHYGLKRLNFRAG